MTAIQGSTTKPAFPQEIIDLQKAAEENPNDLVAKIALASVLEQRGFWLEALEQYKVAQALDLEGLFAEVTEKAMAELEEKVAAAGPSRVSSGPSPRPLSQRSGDRQYPDEILTLQGQADQNPDDLVAKITLASALEQGGFVADAEAVYQEIKILDTDHIFTTTVERALADIQVKLAKTTIGGSRSGDGSSLSVLERQEQKKRQSQLAEKAQATGQTLRQSIADLPIAYKQFVAFLTCSTISVVAVVGAGMTIALFSGRAQLKNQALTESLVTDTNYNIKLNEMGAAFQGQVAFPALIDATKLRNSGQPLPAGLKQQITSILKNQAQAQSIEYVTLVGKDKKIIANANKDRAGQTFNPDDLVESVLKNPRQIRTSGIINQDDLQKEQPPLLKMFQGKDALIRYTVTPVKDPQSDQALGALISGDVVNGKNKIVKDTVEAFDGGYGAIYYVQPDGKLALATAILQNLASSSDRFTSDLALPDLALLEKAQRGAGGALTERMSIGDIPMTVAIKSIPGSDGKPLAFLVRGTPELVLDDLLRRSFALQLGVGVLSLLFAALVAFLLGGALTRPLKKLQATAKRLGAGETGIRADIDSNDEVGQLAQTFNEMADQVEAYTQTIEETAKQQQMEMQVQRKQKEDLQAGAMQLLIDIEEVARGNLTIKSEVQEGAVGSIADAFNATLNRLRALVKQVLYAANEVSDSAQKNRDSVIHLSENAITQTESLELAVKSVADIASSIDLVANSAQTAAAIARNGNQAAQQGQDTIDQTVNSIYKIRSRVADISKKSKRLAESSQEISKIVGIISGISEKTNLLAFNASIEAARAGENGQGFRIVADEVRRLAEMVTVSAQEIEQVIFGIQEETSQMTQMMEESTAEVVTGTKLVQNTKETLQSLATISQEIDTLLDSISQNTETQRLTSIEVTNSMQKVAGVARGTSDSSKEVSTSLQDLAKIAAELQNSASQFTVE